ncbi:MAG: putative Elongation factor 1-alpha [Streblomastix strix]|uniref:Putative Elongation factor 1-alpha n=1 Tax=Streblomastix strix TaxID=222440 RepID=A0A5J4U3T1_9EUKA|nr:MAG: putative Elongation factor 1-alpha [Streblomastix strix]
MPQWPFNKQMHFLIQYVFKIGGIGTVPVECVETGILTPGQIVRVAPPIVTSKCKSVEMLHEALTLAVPGDNVGFNLNGLSIKDIKRVFTFGDSKQNSPQEVESLQAQVIVMQHPGQFQNGYTHVLDYNTSHIIYKFKVVIIKNDRRTHKELEQNPKSIKTGDSAIEYPPIGQFAVRDMRATVAVVVIKEVTKKSHDAKVTKAAEKRQKK